MPRNWTDEQVHRLKDLYPTVQQEDLVTAIGKSWAAIRNKASALGIKRLVSPEHSPESNRKRGETLRGKPKHPGFGEKIAAARLGKPLSEAHRAAISQALRGRRPTFLGRKHRPESIRRMSVSKQGRIPWNKGIPRTPEERAIISQARIGILGKPPKRFEYNGAYYRSGWERAFAKLLDKYAVPFEHERHTFPLVREDGSRTSYTPDFLVKGLWFEIKGMMFRDSAEKLSLFRQQYPDETLFVIGSSEFDRVVELLATGPIEHLATHLMVKEVHNVNHQPNHPQELPVAR